MKSAVKSLIVNLILFNIKKEKLLVLNESKIKELIDKSVEEKLTKLNIPLYSSVVIQSTKKITIDTSTFNEIKK